MLSFHYLAKRTFMNKSTGALWSSVISVWIILYTWCRTRLITIVAIDRRFCIHNSVRPRLYRNVYPPPRRSSPFRTRLTSRFWVYNLYLLFIYFFFLNELNFTALLVLKKYKSWPSEWQRNKILSVKSIRQKLFLLKFHEKHYWPRCS